MKAAVKDMLGKWETYVVAAYNTLAMLAVEGVIPQTHWAYKVSTILMFNLVGLGGRQVVRPRGQATRAGDKVTRETPPVPPPPPPTPGV